MRNFEHCAYTYKHRQAMRYVFDKIIKDQYMRERLSPKIEAHDID